MVDAALQAGTAHRGSVFELFARRLSGARRYGVVAGTGRLLDAIERFRFTDTELDFLRERRIVSPATLDWLSDFRFSGDIWATRRARSSSPVPPSSPSSRASPRASCSKPSL